MTRTTPLDAVILDYNGVIGRQPTRHRWLRLARTASWPDTDLTDFQSAFWSTREHYDSGQLSDMAYWARVLGSHPGPRLLHQLRSADTDVWTATDDRVLSVLRRTHTSGLPMVLLSNAPAHLSDVLDTQDWRRMMTQALYSARKCSSRSACLMRHAVDHEPNAGPGKLCRSRSPREWRASTAT
ncbi:HAD family hydrolase [Streptomyces murinus]|uniref:HAD family phosphatase n=1 Tax=Streptomyces murinus TaxID=33900 RepID=UPI0036EE2493